MKTVEFLIAKLRAAAEKEKSPRVKAALVRDADGYAAALAKMEAR